MIGHPRPELFDLAYFARPPRLNVRPPRPCLVGYPSPELFNFAYLLAPPRFCVSPPCRRLIGYGSGKFLHLANLAAPPRLDVVPPVSSGVFHSRPELLYLTNLVSPPLFSVSPPSCSVILDVHKKLSYVACQFANSVPTFFDLAPDIGTNFFYIVPFLTQKGRHERVNNVVPYPFTDISQGFLKSVPEVAYGFSEIRTLNILIPPVGYVLCNATNEVSDKQGSRPYGSSQEGEETGCDTCVVDIGNKVLYLLPQQTTQFSPVMAIQPLRELVKDTLDKLTDFLCYQSPVKRCEEPDYHVPYNGHLLYQKSAYVTEINFFQCPVKELCNTATYVGEIHRIKEPVRSLNSTIQCKAYLMSDTAPVNAIHNLIDLLTQESTKSFPVSIVKGFTQFVRKVTDILVNREFLKHGTVVSSTTPAATTTRTVVGVVLDDIKFINTHGVGLNFVNGFLCGTRSTFSRTAIGGGYLLRSGKCAFARQPGDKHIYHVQKGSNLINEEVDCRGKCGDYGRSHSTQRVFKVLCACSQSVHTARKLSVHHSTVVVEVVDTLFEPLCDCRNRSTDSPVHGNTL